MTIRSLRIYNSAIRSELSSSRTLRQALQPVAARATRTAQAVAGERTTKRTGKYAAGFRSRVATAAPPAVARIVTENAVPYAGYIEAGTRPHPIDGHGKMLRFPGRGGVIVFRRHVFHPGTTPRRVIEVALKRVARGG